MVDKDRSVFVATQTGSCDVKGQSYTFYAGVTRVRAGHPLLKAAPNLFAPVEDHVHYDVESATNAPGEKRGA